MIASLTLVKVSKAASRSLECSIFNSYFFRNSGIGNTSSARPSSKTTRAWGRWLY